MRVAIVIARIGLVVACLMPADGQGQLGPRADSTTDAARGRLESEKLSRETEKLAREIEKLTLENRKLAEEMSSSLRWPGVSLLLGSLVALFGVIASALVAWVTARRTRWGTFDLAVLQKRLEYYPELVEATRSLALYFPDARVDRTSCREAGDKLRASFFKGAGILLSTEARSRYFALVEGLTRAAAADTLAVPALYDYAHWVSESMVNDYRTELGLRELHEPTHDRVRKWQFGQTAPENRAGLEEPVRGSMPKDGATARELAQFFRDFVLLQALASRLRTALTDDIRGRRRPEE